MFFLISVLSLSAFSQSKEVSSEVSLIEIVKIEQRPTCPFVNWVPCRDIRPGFIGLYDEESERALSLYLNPLINKEDPFTIRITGLDLVHQTYLGR